MQTNAQKDRYKRRVLHRASDHSSPNKEPLNVFVSKDLTAEQRKVFSKELPKKAYPILLYWRDKDTWTVLGANFIYSFYSERLTIIDLDKINPNEIDLDGFNYDMDVKLARNLKMNCEFLHIKNLDKKVWCFSGLEQGSLFTLWNILLRYQVDKKFILSLKL